MYRISNSIVEKFPFGVENVVLGSHKSFFQLDHKLVLASYLMEAIMLRYWRGSAYWTSYLFMGL